MKRIGGGQLGNAGARLSSFRVHHRTSGDGWGCVPVFHPSNGDVTHMVQTLDNQTIHTHPQVDGIVDGMYVKLPIS